MSDNNNPLPPPITDKDNIYIERLANSENRKEHPTYDFDYYYIKKYESDMKWYKKYIRITILIPLIALLALIIWWSVIKRIELLGIILPIFLCAIPLYFNNEYRNSKKNRDRYIQDAKDKIETEIKEKRDNDENLNRILKEVNNASRKSKEDSAKKIKEITPIINNLIYNIANDNSMDDEAKITALYNIYKDKIYNNNIYYFDYFDYYKTFIENNKTFNQNIKDGVKQKTSNIKYDYAKMRG